MTLLSVRTQVAKVSGRYDLVTDAPNDDYSDNGMDYYINAGMRMLDKMVDIPESQAKLYYALAAGEYSLTFQFHCRYIEEVWINGAEERWQLIKVELNELKQYYDQPASSTTQGEPGWYALAELRALETTAQSTLATFINKTWTETDEKYDYRGIIIVPPADGSYVVEISGKFKQATLSADGDENFWTQEEPDLLARAALYKLEAFSRGTENAKNWLSAIVDDVRLLDMDVAAEESYGINQMRG